MDDKEKEKQKRIKEIAKHLHPHDDERINELRDKLANQLVWDNSDIDKFVGLPDLDKFGFH